MTPAPQPVAALGDAITLVVVLLAARHLLLLVRGGWSGWVARWLRRIIAVAVLLPALRLFSLTGARPDIAGSLWAVGAAILFFGAALLVADGWLAARRQR